MKRRHFLRGMGACVALPNLPSMGAQTAPIASAAGALATTPSGAPLRLAFVYFPNGAIPKGWNPSGKGQDYQLGETMEALRPLRDKMQVIAGLDCENATPGPDGAGDHARASGSFLTGVRVRKTAGSDINAGISIDQVAANNVGHLTRFPSLELTCDSVRKSGSCDSGYSCAYQYNLAWRSPTQPMAPEPNPRLFFERLFGAGSPGERLANLAQRQQQQRSILDFVLDDARDLQKKLANRDRQKLDEYLTSMREIERRLERMDELGTNLTDPDVETPAGIPADFENHIEVMFDMLALAFETDSSRVATYLLANEGSNRAFPELGISEGHHYLTHHRSDPKKVDKVQLIDRFYVGQFARFLEKLDRTEDVDGQSILHNSMIVYGCGNSDGNRHTHSDLPVILAGSGGGALRTGRHVNYGSRPITDLYLNLTDLMGVQGLERFGDSTGRLDRLI